MKLVTDGQKLAEVVYTTCRRGLYPQWSGRHPGLLFLRILEGDFNFLLYFSLETFEEAAELALKRMEREKKMIEGLRPKKGKMEVVVRKVDMDTCLTALLLGVSSEDRIVVRREGAIPLELCDPKVVCIEAGGSGRVDMNDFDHHDTSVPLPPACRQAYDRARGLNKSLPIGMERLVEYVERIDVSGPDGLGPRPPFPTLSDVFSGMLLTTEEPEEQLLKGMAILEEVLRRELDPWGTMPDVPEWEEYVEAKRRNDEELRKLASQAELFTTNGGLRAGYLKTDIFGALGVLYKLGCKVAIAHSPNFGNPPVSKYTIGGDGVRVDKLLPILNGLEPGWGGPSHGTIVGSPAEGSKLSPEEVKRMVRENL